MINIYLIKKISLALAESFKTFRKAHPSQLIMTLLVKNEESILEENLLFHKAMGVDSFIITDMKRGLRGSLKTGNLVTGALYVDLDFYPNTPAITGIREFNGYQIIPTVSGGLAQIQQRLMEALDKINKLPLNPMIEQATSTLSESQRTMKNLQTTLDSMNKILASQSMQQLPTDMQSTLRELNRSMQGFQPGSAAYNKMVADMQRLDQVLRELQPVLKTLNEKSNALVFEAKDKKDPEPKRAKQ